MNEKIKDELEMLEMNKNAILTIEEGKRVYGLQVMLNQIEKRILELELLG